MTGQARAAWLAIGVITAMFIFTSADPYPWHISRASGVVAYLMLWLSTTSGLASSSRIGRMVLPAPEVFDIHSFAAYLMVPALGIHGLALLADGWVSFSIAGVLVPGVSEYRPLPVATGIIAAYISIVATFSFKLRNLIGARRWRRLHYIVFPGFALALLHGLLAGSDSSTVWAAAMYWSTGGAVLFLVFLRILGGAELRAPNRKPATGSR